MRIITRGELHIKELVAEYKHEHCGSTLEIERKDAQFSPDPRESESWFICPVCNKHIAFSAVFPRRR